jgi:uncharacterized protein YndB with AHSA1/START domain
MTITGTLDGPDLVLRRTVPGARDRIWRHLADPDRLATWYGTFTGDPAEGTIELTMTAEPGEPATSTWTVHACERGRLLTVSSAMGEDTWRLSVELDDAADGAGGAAGDLTRLALRHHEVPAEMVQHVGPGWEWYLDRLVGAVTGTRVPGMDVWDEEYMSRAPEYAALVG